MVPPAGFEPATPSLGEKCSSPELRGPARDTAASHHRLAGGEPASTPASRRAGRSAAPPTHSRHPSSAGERPRAGRSPAVGAVRATRHTAAMTTTAPAPDRVQRHVVRTLSASPGPRRRGRVRGGGRRCAARRAGRGSADAGRARRHLPDARRGALIAIPMARVMAARGRRPGLPLGYVLAASWARSGMIIAGAIRNFPLLLVVQRPVRRRQRPPTARPGMPRPTSRCRSHRGRDLTIVVWATTDRQRVFGPNLVGPSAPVARRLGLPALTGPYVFSLDRPRSSAIAVVSVRLRPDPLPRGAAAADRRRRRPRPAPHGSVSRGLAGPGRHPGGPPRAAHARPRPHGDGQRHGDDAAAHGTTAAPSLRVIGLVISIHVSGMFAFSPLTGLAVDRFGGRAVAVVGVGDPVDAALLAPGVPEGGRRRSASGCSSSGWAGRSRSWPARRCSPPPCPPCERPGAQGASDLVMGLVAGLGGALAGVVVDRASFTVLALVALGGRDRRRAGRRAQRRCAPTRPRCPDAHVPP